MNDFLTRLASLTRGEATAVKPRLPGHFAPLPDTQAPEPLDDVILVTGAFEKDLEPGRAQRRAAPERVPAAPVSGASGQDNETDKRQQTDNTNIAAHAPRMIHGEAGDERAPRQAPAGRLPALDTDAEPANRQTPAVTYWSVPGFDTTGDTEIQAGPLRPGDEADPAPRREQDTAAPPPSSPAHPKLLVRGQTAGREEAGLLELPDLPEVPRRTQGEPAVHVNIGRIEVRASTLAPRPHPGPAPARQQSSLSLQDYLARGQTGGKRS